MRKSWYPTLARKIRHGGSRGWGTGLRSATKARVSRMRAFQGCPRFKSARSAKMLSLGIRRTNSDFYIAFMSTVYNCCIRGNRHGDQTRQATQDSQRSAMGCDGSHGKRSLLGVYGCLEHGEPLQCFRVLGSRKSPFLSGGDLGCSSSHLTVRDWSCYR